MSKKVPQPVPVSATRAVAAALRRDQKLRDAASAAQREALTQAQKEASDQIKLADSFQSFAFKMGIGTDSPLSKSTFGFNPITRDRTLCEWAYRGSWTAGKAVDVIAEDMTRKGVDQKGEIDPSDAQTIETANTTANVWGSLCDAIRWARLYGGGLAVMLIDGQDPSTPLRVDSIGKGQFKGLLPLGRWEVEPNLSDLVQEFGPNLGMPKWYTISAAAAGLPQMTIHYTRCIRLVGVAMPFQQKLAENMWGISILERIYDRLLSFEWATTGAAQLVSKAYLRTMKIEGLREIIGQGGKLLDALVQQMSLRQRFQGIEGIDMIDATDEFETHNYTFAGLSDILGEFGIQLCGAVEIPLVRFFGTEPGGLGNDGESALNTYNDGISRRQNTDILVGVSTLYKVQAKSCGITVPEDYKVEFRPLYQMKEEMKAEVSERTTNTVLAAKDSGLVSERVALKELKQSSNITGIWSNITDEDIEAASDEAIPSAETVLPGGAQPKAGLVEAGAEQAAQEPGKPGKEPDPEQAKARDSATLFKTSVGPRLVCCDYDVPLLGGGSEDGKVVFVHRAWNPMIKDGLLKGLNRLPYLVEHEAVEDDEEREGKGYATAHYDHAEPAEHKKLLEDLKITPGTLEAKRAVKAYEASYDQDLKDAGSVREPQLPPDMIPKPYEHPHNVRQRRLLQEVKAKDSVSSVSSMMRLHGLHVAIENPKDSKRSGTAADTGKSWEAVLPADYGYIRRTKGADEDEVDCFVGAEPAAETAYIIDQKRLDTGSFDEHKCMLGFPDRASAINCYMNAYSDGLGSERIGSISEMNMPQFRSWLQNADLTKPSSAHFKPGRRVA